MKELSELSVKGQLCLTKRQLGNQEEHVVEVASPCPTPPHPHILHPQQGLIEENNLGVSNVNTPATRCILGHYTLYKLLTFRSKLNINLLLCF